VKKRVFAIPLDEVNKHLKLNSRQDIKIVVPEILTAELYRILLERGKDIKPEVPLEGHRWKHSGPGEPNRECASSDFIDVSLPQYAQGPFAISFANENAVQDEHYHRQHVEIYCSQQPIAAEFRYLGDSESQSLELLDGGVVIFGPEVIHRIMLKGLTTVIEIPSVSSDKVNEKLRPGEFGQGRAQ
jgi:hypothetical protein